MLRKRGFLIDKVKEQYFLSDNSDVSDWDYLNDILVNDNWGKVYRDGRIEIRTEISKNDFGFLFNESPRGLIGTESNIKELGWYKVYRHRYTDKIPVAWLEPYIARYIKALSSCGISTGGCCDGNHPGMEKMFIEFDGPIYQEYHALLWQYYLNMRFDIAWNDKYNEINLKENREHQYEMLNIVAEYIYENRNFFIDIRLEAAKWMNKKSIKCITKSEIKEHFLKEVKNILYKENSSYANRL